MDDKLFSDILVNNLHYDLIAYIQDPNIMDDILSLHNIWTIRAHRSGSSSKSKESVELSK